MDVVKMQQSVKEDPEFVRQRRATINALLSVSGQISKRQRFSTQDVMKGSNVAKRFAQLNQKMSIQRPNGYAASFSSSVSEELVNLAAIKTIKGPPRVKKNNFRQKYRF
jgi:hypothetical protein